MKRKSLLLIMLVCIISLGQLHAQYNLPESRIWAMGNDVGLDFTDINNPVPISTSLANGNEAAASICDTGGHLLFYSNGQEVWNKNGAAMPNGTSLIPAGGSTLSTTQGAVIVPMPDSAGKYYLFSLTQVSNCQLYCNVIDMSLDGGLGDVDVNFSLRLQSLGDSALTEKMTVVAGCNNSVWLMVHSQGTNVFRAYQVTSAGINLTPVISVVGTFPGTSYQQGVIKFSPDRTKMLTCDFVGTSTSGAGIEVYDFDYTTGILSNTQVLDAASYYGGTFSADGLKVYAQSPATSAVYQWDLTAANPSGTKLMLGSSGQYTDMKLGPDGKIYFGALAGSPGYNNYRFMGRVNSPDSAGIACAFQDSVTALTFPNPNNNSGHLSQEMPNDVAVPVPAVDQYVRSLDTNVCTLFQPYALTAPAGYSTRVWDNGDTTLTRTVTARNTYWVQSTSACNTRVDTFIIGGADMPAFAVTYANQRLTATAGFANYQWYKDGVIINGANANTYSVTQDGTYSVNAVFGGGCSDSVYYRVAGVTAVAQYNTLSALTIYPNPAQNTLYVSGNNLANITIFSVDGKQVLADLHTSKIDISSLAAGLYFVHITDDNGQYSQVQKIIKAN